MKNCTTFYKEIKAKVTRNRVNNIFEIKDMVVKFGVTSNQTSSDTWPKLEGKND